jgi:hypothetical protein
MGCALLLFIIGMSWVFLPWWLALPITILCFMGDG